MEKFTVVVTDTRMSDLKAEREVLSAIGAELLDATPVETEDDFIAFAREADGLINERRRVTRHIIESLPKLKVITRYAVGMDSIDIPAATERGICVANVPDFCTREVADHTIALLLACNRWIVRLHKAVQEGTWNDRATLLPLRRLEGQTVGLLGFGRIAQAVASRAQAFGLLVIAFDPFLPGDAFSNQGVTRVELRELLTRADYVSIHVPITSDTRHLIGAEEIALMKPDAYLINTSRGAVVDEAALISALEEGRIAGAGLDVFEREPLRPDNPLFCFPNVVLTPHTAFHTRESLKEVLRKAAVEVARVLQGHWPKSLLNTELRSRLLLRD